MGLVWEGRSRHAPRLVSLPCGPLVTWVSLWCIVTCMLEAPHHMHASGSLALSRGFLRGPESIHLTAGASQAEGGSPQLSGMRVGGQVPWQLGCGPCSSLRLSLVPTEGTSAVILLDSSSFLFLLLGLISRNHLHVESEERLKNFTVGC